MQVLILPLVPDAPLPRRAQAASRSPGRPGYGVQEQCLPFTAAAGLGLLVPAPFDFGLCLPAEVPPLARAFRPPPAADVAGDRRTFYVCDRPSSRFTGNAFTFDALPFDDEQGQRREIRPVHPGLSFFDREDQAHLFKLHLPWLLRTPPQVDSFFGQPINRPVPVAMHVGLVETDWYAHPVNLVLLRPTEGSLHVRAGDTVAQVNFVARAARRVDPEILPRDGSTAHALHNELLQWHIAHGRDRSAYRRLARSEQGRLVEAQSNGAGP
ncbi:DUF6065 family protein [Variovorax sp. LjRoot84]|uniref:DUF6065 family protein n=1 Tax=Variovorax sp. LjRoot84 TaxID=3342340 RepID=UPI003ECE59C3